MERPLGGGESIGGDHPEDAVFVEGFGQPTHEPAVADRHLGPGLAVALQPDGHRLRRSPSRWCITSLRAVNPDSSKKFLVDRCPGRATASMPEQPWASHHTTRSTIIASPTPTCRAPS